jgi:hypothetical protein
LNDDVNLLKYLLEGEVTQVSVAFWK